MKKKRAHKEKGSSPVYHHEDIAQKLAAAFFAQEVLPLYGVTGKVVSAAPTELADVKVSNLYQDYNYVMNDGSWKHIEFESTDITTEKLKKFRAYEGLASYQYNVDITTYVVCSAKARVPKAELTSGLSSYRIVPICMGDKDAGEFITLLQDKIKQNEEVSRAELVQLVLCPIMGGSLSQYERIRSALEIIKGNRKLTKEDRETLTAVLYVLAAKFLDPEEMKVVKEVMQMTLLGEMIFKDGLSLGLSQGHTEGFSQGRTEGRQLTLTAVIRNLLGKGYSQDSMAEILDMDKEEVRKICGQIQEEQKKTDPQIHETLVKGQQTV